MPPSNPSRPAVPPADPWPPELVRFRWDGLRLRGAELKDDESAGRDSLGTPGRMRTRTHLVRIEDSAPHTAVRKRLEEAGMRLVTGDGERSELAVPFEPQCAELADPLLLESRVSAVVRGRSFPGQQRAVVEGKVEALRRELAAGTVDPARRVAAEQMLRSLESGLTTTVDLRFVERRFRPLVPVVSPRRSMGAVLSLRVGSKIVYRVRSAEAGAGPDAEEPADGETEPMVFHVVAIGAREVAMLCTGGCHGFRHIADLAGGRTHHAWFGNRERIRTDATAPWIGRQVYRELVDQGTSVVVVHPRRDAGPIEIVKVSDDISVVQIDGRPADVPVLRARTSAGDEFVILADEDSPLVLRLVEAGANLVRTIDGVRSPPPRSHRSETGSQTGSQTGDLPATTPASAVVHG